MTKNIIVSLIFLLSTQPVSAQVMISEIMYDPAGSDGGQEWVEIYNSGQEAVSIDSVWRFDDGSKHLLNLYQGTSTLDSGAYAVIADNPSAFLIDYPDYNGILFDSVVSMTNSGSTIALWSGQDVIDQVHFVSAWGGSGTDKTLERLIFVSPSDAGHWQESLSLGGSPGRAAPPLPPVEVPDKQSDYEGIILNEVLPNPPGDDVSGEWIELYNSSDQEKSLIGLKVTDGTNTYPFGNETILPRGYLLLTRSQTGIALNNTNDSLQLINISSGEIIDQTEYESAREGYSWSRNDDTWAWSTTPTAGAENNIPENKAPTALAIISADDYRVNKSISFDASGSSDPEGSPLSFMWEFGDGQTSNRKAISHKYANAGTYTILLRVQDAEGKSAESRQTIVINDNQTKSSPTPTVNKFASDAKSSDAVATVVSERIDDEIIISEVLPNPTGSDEQEWIEIFNQSDRKINLSGYQLDDAEGGSKPFSFPQGTIIEPQTYQVWSRLASKIALNNDKDSVRLLAPDNQEVFVVDYSAAKEGWSYVLNQAEDEWLWNEYPNPGQAHTVVLGLSLEQATSSPSMTWPAETETIFAQVIVPPGLWYKQRMYVQAQEATDDKVIEVYLHNADYPDITIGSQVQLFARSYDDSRAIPRLKLQTGADIIPLDIEVLDWPAEVSIMDIDENSVGQYLTVRSTIQKVNKRTILIGDSADNTLTMYLHPAVDWSSLEFQKDQSIMLRGIVLTSGSDIIIRPVAAADIQLEQRVQTDALPTVTSSTIVSLPPVIPQKFPWWYIGSAGLVAAGYLVWKRQSQKA